jgi:hypothetical protein
LITFPANFHFALVGHLLKGFRHPNQSTVGRTARVLTMLLAIVARPHQRDKFEVTPESVAYLAALLPVSEEVRSRCRLRHPSCSPVAVVVEDVFHKDSTTTANGNGNGTNGKKNGNGEDGPAANSSLPSPLAPVAVPPANVDHPVAAHTHSADSVSAKMLKNTVKQVNK